MAFWLDRFRRPDEEDIWEELRQMLLNSPSEQEIALKKQQEQAWIDSILNKAFPENPNQQTEQTLKTNNSSISPMGTSNQNTLGGFGQNSINGFTHKKKETDNVQSMFKKMNVKTPSLDTEIGTLSGGNQQKVLLTRWMLCNPDVMILDEPTRGIDVGAKFEIYKLITEIVKEEKAVVMVSSELPELIGMCDRIYIMCQGHISGCITRDEFSQETIMRYAMDN